MATKPITIPATQMLIKIGNGADPEVYTAPCGLTTKGFSRSAEVSTSSTPYCDTPDDPVWTDSDVVSLSWSLTGSGNLTTNDAAIYDEWFASGEPRNVQIDVGGTRRYTGAALLTACEVSGEGKSKVTRSITLTGTGPLVATTP